MKNLFSLFLLLVTTVTTAVAQTFYVMEYKDKDDIQYKALILYNGDGDEPSEMRKIFVNSPDPVFTHTYYSQRYDDEEEDVEETTIPYTIMISDDKPNYAPTLFFFWDPDETYVQQRTPWLAFKKRWRSKDLIRADYFHEITLLDLNETLISQFYRKDDEMYQRLLNAHNVAVQQEAELVRTLGDGTDIYRALCNGFYDFSSSQVTMDDVMNHYYGEYYKYYGRYADKDPKSSVASSTVASPSQNGSGQGMSLVNPNPNRRNPLMDDEEEEDAAPEATMHVMIVANTEISDIGQAVNMDLRRISSEMKGVCSKLGLTYKPYLVSGMDFGREELNKKLKEIECAPNDIIVFLYSGHGFRWQDQIDPYPQLALVTDDYTDIKKSGSFVALSDIDRALSAKNARLTLVLADCCNSVYGEASPLPLGTNSLMSRGNTNLSTERLRSLFLNYEGHIICTAASPGEVSWCNQAGGNFTCNFLEAFRREINLLSEGAEASWNNIFESTVLNTRKFSDQNALKAQNAVKELKVNKKN